jgi:magnesium chelatase family protein
VLYLDELEEYPSNLLETLRQPLERGFVQVVHRRRTVRLPARLLLVAATPYPDRPARLPGLTRLDDVLAGLGWGRMDVAVDVPPLRVSAIEAGLQTGEPSAAVRERVTAARARQHARGHGLNANLPPRELIGQYPRHSRRGWPPPPPWTATTA